MSEQELVIKCDDCLGEGHRFVINKTSNLKSYLGESVIEVMRILTNFSKKWKRQATTEAGGQ